jgi:predicted nucleic acid-binding protein
MIVVSDTSPLNYLVLIEAVEILPKLFGRVVVPQAVVDELTATGAPDAVRVWIENPPRWLEVRIPQLPDTSLALGRGERDAICMAVELSALCLLDDRKARREAERRGVKVAGLLAILAEAKDRGLIDADEIVERLAKTSFRASRALIAAVLHPTR